MCTAFFAALTVQQGARRRACTVGLPVTYRLGLSECKRNCNKILAELLSTKFQKNPFVVFEFLYVGRRYGRSDSTGTRRPRLRRSITQINLLLASY